MSWHAKLSLIASLAALVSTSAEAGPVRGVVELFTSQGCSSCPPADEVLADLAADPSVVALSLPVDYWDRLGWKDTFASPAFSERQRRYGVVRGDGEVYTPQAVVNGASHVNGSSRSGIANVIDRQSTRLSVPVFVKADTASIEVSVGSTAESSDATYSVLVMPIYGQRSVAIGRGENANRKVVYTHIVREIIPAGAWNGAGKSYRVPRAKLKDAEGVAVIVQRGSISQPGPIVGAALEKF